MFVLAGSKVVLAARNEERLAQAARELEGYGGRALAVLTEVTDRQAKATIGEWAKKSGQR